MECQSFFILQLVVGFDFTGKVNLMLQKIFYMEPLLRNRYNSPHYGNKENPVDELIYILLSKRTNLKCNQNAYDNIKARFPDWKMILDANIEQIEETINVGGLIEEKSINIQGLCRKIYDDFGTFNLRTIFKENKWEEQKIYDYLISLPGIGPKSAYCVMLYSLKLPVMPADIHIIRILYRVELIPFTENQHHQAQKYISETFIGLPWSFQYSLHVNMKAHGEMVCKRQECLREKCVISMYCGHLI